MKQISAWMLSMVTVLACAPLFAANPPKLSLPARFGDHMVLQRQKPIPLEGTAAPKADVTITLGDQSARTRADKTGAWKATLPAFEAGGPYVLTVDSRSETLTVQDVLVGEVWFASGQSNMEWILNQVKDADRFIALSGNPNLRLFTQKQTLAASPKAEADGTWMISSPDTAKYFSAVGYFFGRDLQKALGVPVGIVCAAWGGSAGESWMTKKALASDKDLQPILDHYNAEKTETRKGWLFGAPRAVEFKDMLLIPKDASRQPRTIGEADWSANARAGSPVTFKWVKKGGAGEKVGRFEGLYQAAAWGGANSPLNGGKSDDLSGYETLEVSLRGNGVYKLAFSQPSIRDYDYYNSAPVTLTKDWKKYSFKIADFKQGGWGLAKPFTPAELVNVQFQVVMGPLPALPSAMFNGMVAPWVTTPMRGAIWYQGETNAGRAEQYGILLPALIRDWREAWKDESFAFLTVQLPIYDPTTLGDEAGAWPELREAQLKSLALPKTAVVTTLDVGMKNNIHPVDKEPVGARLALSALNVAYGRAGGLCPLFASLRAEGDKVFVSFKNTEGALKAKGPVKGFAVAGEDQVFHPVAAKIKGDQVVLTVPKGVGLSAVRYGWADVTEANLTGKTGLPVAPFRTDDWPLLTHGRR